MIGGCILSAQFGFTADVYKQYRQVDQSTGQTKRKWNFQKTIKCNIKPFVSTSYRAQSVSETFGENYEKLGFFTLVSKEPLSDSYRVTNIRNKEGLLLKELEVKNNPATVFNCNGSVPDIDAFSRVVQWNTLISRSESQELL